MIKRVQEEKKQPKKETPQFYEEKLTELQLGWWKDIKDVKIDIFGFTGRDAGDFLKPLNMSEDALYLMSKAPAVVPALELSLGSLTVTDPSSNLKYPKYSVITEDKYVVIRPTKAVVNKDFEGKMFLTFE